jgi:restriction system protein
VQCKHWKATSVGVDVVRQIFGVMAAHGATGCVVVTSGSYTSAALNFARGRNVDLIDGPKLLKMMEQSDPATAGGLSTPPSEEHHAEPGLTETFRRSTPQLTPRCPLCQSAMAKRTARKGPNAGQEFWGCTRDPDCRGTR